jgi:hypothetical protein
MLRNFVRCSDIVLPWVAILGITAKEVNAGDLVAVPGLPDSAHILLATSSSKVVVPLVDGKFRIPSTFEGKTGAMALVSNVLALRATEFLLTSNTERSIIH